MWQMRGLGTDLAPSLRCGAEEEPRVCSFVTPCRGLRLMSTETAGSRDQLDQSTAAPPSPAPSCPPLLVLSGRGLGQRETGVRVGSVLPPH